MSVTQAQRHHLYESLKEHLGAEEADTLMNLIPPVDWSALATKSDLAALQAATRSEIADVRTELRTEIADLRTELRTEIAEVRVEIAGLRTDLTSEIAGMKNDLLRTLGTWLFASQAAVIASVVGFVSFVR